MDRGGGRQRLYRRFVAEDVVASLRHTLVNKLSGLGALAFHIKRQLPEGETSTAVSGVLPLLDAELGQAIAALDLRFLTAPAPRPDPVPLAAALAETVRTFGQLRAPGVELIGPAHDGATGLIDPDELDLAVFCLLENACEAAAAHGQMVRVRCGEGPDGAQAPAVTVEVLDDGPGFLGEARLHARDPFFSTKPGRLGLGLNVALRVAQRARGRLELAAADSTETGPRQPGVAARLVLPRGPR
jgi:signal transduction histidine kinase